MLQSGRVYIFIYCLYLYLLIGFYSVSSWFLWHLQMWCVWKPEKRQLLEKETLQRKQTNCSQKEMWGNLEYFLPMESCFSLTLYTLTSVQIFSILFSIHFLRFSGRICPTIKSISYWWSFPLLSWPLCVFQGWYCMENIDSHRVDSCVCNWTGF